LRIKVTKNDFRIKVVKVMALAHDGSIAEQAEIVKDFQCWNYRFLVQKDSISKIVVVVQDEVGNVLMQEAGL
ncbi:hypothetical protein, partial [Chryseosolibacter indicus]